LSILARIETNYSETPTTKKPHRERHKAAGALPEAGAAAALRFFAHTTLKKKQALLSCLLCSWPQSAQARVCPAHHWWPQALPVGPGWLVAGAGSSASKRGLAPGEHVGVPSGQRGLQQSCLMGLGVAPNLGMLLAPGLVASLALTSGQTQCVSMHACMLASNRCHIHHIWHSGDYLITPLLRRSGLVCWCALEEDVRP